mgnify:CR=1 FL=1|tara:strand:- start:2939 stop:3994 length:1056 start_codon:yes stop_codon:yes gene_type:complete
MAGTQFDIGEGMFFFFRRVGEKPMGALWLAFCQALVGAALVALTLMLMGPVFINIFEMAELDSSGAMTDAEITERMFSIIGPMLAVMPLIGVGGIVIALMFQGAWLRFLVRGEIAAGIPFRLGSDEFRLLGVNLLYIVIAFAGYIGLVIAMVVVGGAAALVFAGADGSIGGGLVGGLIAFVGALVIACVLVMVCIRLATAPGLTIRDRKLRFFESWSASNGVFWHMALSYLVVLGLILVLGSILSFLVQLVFLGALMPALAQLSAVSNEMSGADVEQVFAQILTTISNPAVATGLIIGMTLSYLLQIVFEGMWHGVGAYNAVRYRADGQPEEMDSPVLGADHPAGASPTNG